MHMRNDFQIENDYVVIHLQDGKKALIDLEDLPVVMEVPTRWTHYMRRTGKECVQGSVRVGRKPDGSVKYKVVQLHRIIVDHYNKNNKGQFGFHKAIVRDGEYEVGHRNGNGLDCRKKNLKVVDRRCRTEVFLWQ